MTEDIKLKVEVSTFLGGIRGATWHLQKLKEHLLHFLERQGFGLSIKKYEYMEYETKTRVLKIMVAQTKQNTKIME